MAKIVPSNAGFRRAAIGTLPLVAAVMCAGVANANPHSGHDAWSPQGQPGETTDSPAVMADQAAPASDYSRSRPVPQQHYAAPIDPGKLHAPMPQRPVAPVIAPPGTIRIGGLVTPAPDWIPSGVRDQINTSAADSEAQVSTAARSVGITPARADRVAAGTAEGAGIGFGVGAIPGAVLLGTVGAVLGGAVGGLVGFIVVPVVGAGPGAVLGAAAGAAALGAVGGVLTGTLLGLVPGTVIGGAASLMAP